MPCRATVPLSPSPGGVSLSTEYERADDEGNALAHEASDEGDIAAEPVELGDCNFTFRLLGGLERGLELRAAIERVGTLAGLALEHLVFPRLTAPIS